MYDLLFSPGKIGGLTLPNRIAMTAASASLSQPDGTMTEDMLAYYEARAKGGVGLIITEMVCVDEDRGVLFPRELNAAREENIPSFRRLADRVHPHGTKIFAQLFHPGASSPTPSAGSWTGGARSTTSTTAPRPSTAPPPRSSPCWTPRCASPPPTAGWTRNSWGTS